MGGDDNGDMRFQLRGDSVMNCPSSGMNTNPMYQKVGGVAMSSIPMFKSSIGGDSFYGSGWDPLVSLSQGENYGGSSMVSPNEFPDSNYHVVMENQGISRTSHLAHYSSSDASLVKLVPKLSCFGSGSFSEMVGSFGLPECGQTTITGCPQSYPSNKEGGIEKISANDARSHKDCRISEEGASPNGKRRKRVIDNHSPFNPNMNSEGEQQMELSEGSTEFLKDQDDKKQKLEKNTGTRRKQTDKQTKDKSQCGEAPKENYIHVRARRGQATNSHSLAERVRREKISERMRMLQELVPGCNKITGKAVMLDEIINYVQSLQQQVEFLSMKLSTVNPELNIDLERILSKDILHSRRGSAAILGIGSGMNTPHYYPHGILQETLPGIPTTAPQFHPMPQTVWDTEIQSLLQMGFDSNPAVDSLGLNGRSKPEIGRNETNYTL